MLSSRLLIAISGLLILFPSIVISQSRTNATGTGGIHEIRGRIYLPDGRSPELPIKIELQSISNFAYLSVETDRNGSYSFRALAPGTYTVFVKEGDLFDGFSDTVTIDTEPQTPIRIRPTPKIVTVPVNLRLKQNIIQKAAVVNAKLAAVPKPAADLYEQAQKSIAEGNKTKALEQLRQAVAVYNPFSLAWTDLGVILEKNGDLKGAIDAFRNAVRFDNDSLAAILSLGCALTDNKEYTEAEKYLAVALTKDGNLYRGHFYMGIVQTKLGRLDIAELAFLKAIEVGGNRSAKAHYMLAGVYWATSQYKRAADHLETYLKLDPSAKDAVKVRESIAELRRKEKGPMKESSSNRFS